jgi:hypothetical protein
MPTLRSQDEFFTGGMIPVDAQPSAYSICTEILDTGVVKIIICGHCYNLVCVQAWFHSHAARRGSCPNYRRELYEPDKLLGMASH